MAWAKLRVIRQYGYNLQIDKWQQPTFRSWNMLEQFSQVHHGPSCSAWLGVGCTLHIPLGWTPHALWRRWVGAAASGSRRGPPGRSTTAMESGCWPKTTGACNCQNTWRSKMVLICLYCKCQKMWIQWVTITKVKNFTIQNHPNWLIQPSDKWGQNGFI